MAQGGFPVIVQLLNGKWFCYFESDPIECMTRGRGQLWKPPFIARYSVVGLGATIFFLAVGSGLLVGRLRLPVWFCGAHWVFSPFLVGASHPFPPFCALVVGAD